MARTITAAVGLNAVNYTKDIRTIQSLLNRVPVDQGGPTVKLIEDGLFGDKTARAISGFQLRQFGWADGVVSPGQQTLRRLNELAGDDGPDVAVVAAVELITRMLQCLLRAPGVVPSLGVGASQ